MDVPNNKFPFVTCYARILDRITLNPITEFIDALDDTKTWDLGVILNKGGYSQYIIEFDIWNNEPVVSNGFTQQKFDNAENCNVSIWENELMESSLNNLFSIPFVQIKNSTLNNKDEFNNIIEYNRFCNIYGNVNLNNIQTLNGLGDHTKFQIGIELPEIDITGKINFVTCFEYTAQNLKIDLFFNCTFNIISELLLPEFINIGKETLPMSGKISMPPVYLPRGRNITIIEAYDLNQNLKDQYFTTDYIYNVFLTSGIYNFIIRDEINKRSFNNIEVKDGIEIFYQEIKYGLIAKIYEDVIEYYNIENHEDNIQYYKSNKYNVYGRDSNTHNYNNCNITFNNHNHDTKEIFGYILDEYNEPIKNAEIIITHDDKIIVYYKTNELGQYKFCLKNGIYDVRIRANDKKLKIIRDFYFDNNKGFFSQIKTLSSDFNNDINFTCNY